MGQIEPPEVCCQHQGGKIGDSPEKQVTTGGNTVTTLFVYDRAGHLLGEYDGSGTMEQEYIWLRNRPVAVVTPAGTYYIQTDQRGAPRTVTDAAGSVVWQWQPTPFGTGAPTGSLTFNLRYPGQYYDAETGNVYNHARYYDASLGRYLESDPIGLAGGLDSYAYAMGNPVNHVDPMGLAAAPPPPEEPVTVPFAPPPPPPPANNDSSDPYGNYNFAVAVQRAFSNGAENFSDFVKWAEFGGPLPYFMWPSPSNCPIQQNSEHKKNKRPSTEEKHQKGKARAAQDYGKEKGDKYRGRPRKRPPDWKAPWPGKGTGG